MFVERKLHRCHCIEDLRRAARRVLPRMIFDFVDGGAQSESTVRANREALERRCLIPSGPVNVHSRSCAMELFGVSQDMPLIVGPTGMAGAFWPDADVALARAAARHNIPFVVSNGATCTLETIVAAAPGHVWLQLYLPADRETVLSLLHKARDLGISTLEVTVDTAVPGRRLRDVSNEFGLPFNWSLSKLADVLRHPGWMLRSLRAGMPKFGLIHMKAGGQWETMSEFMRSQVNPAVNWEDLGWLRDRWQGRLIVKGLMDVAQMPELIAGGFDGVVVSNHGGRQLDGAAGTLEVLAEFVEAAAGRVAVLVDSGFRSGTDVLKALALGAQAVQIGRAPLYGLSVAGEAGVDRALSIFKTELDIAMALTGLTRLGQAHPRMLRVI